MPSKQPTSAIAIIPARYASSRFPGKVLASIAGKPMIWWVYQQASKATLIRKVIVAADDARVKKVVEEFGGNLVMTSRRHKSGTDRAAEVAEKVRARIIVNVQADEPLMSPRAIDTLVAAMADDTKVQMATLCRRAGSNRVIFNPNTVCVVRDHEENALYFSRAPIPFNRDAQSAHDWIGRGPYYQHVGIYAYRRSFLMKISALPQSDLEKVEKLEQLRILQAGHRIRVIETDYDPVGVDVATDIKNVEKLMGRSKETYA